MANREEAITRQDDPNYRPLCYHEVPMHYAWIQDRDRNYWRPRTREQKTVGRVVVASPSSMERFALRLLLHHVPGPNGFEDLLTVNGQTYNTFQAAAQARHVLDQNDHEYHQCLAEAITVITSGRELCSLFATILMFGKPINAGRLWEDYPDHFSADFQHMYRANEMIVDVERCYAEALHDLHRILTARGKSLSDFKSMQRLPELPTDTITDAIAVNRREQEHHLLLEQVRTNIERLNPQQRLAFDTIIGAINDPAIMQRAFFVDGAGGSRKTFLYNTLLAHVHAQGKIALAVASTGIAALLLHEGTTAHSRFKIPVQELDSISTCDISVQSANGRLIQSHL